MILTDLDGVRFIIQPEMIKEIKERKRYREIITQMNDHLKVREDVAYIMWLAMEERNAGSHK